MVKVSVPSCDICGAIPAAVYSVESGTRRARADICEVHSRELESFLEEWSVTRQEGEPIPGVRETSSYSHYLATMEEVEQLRREYLAKQKRTPTEER